ncbi:MAG: type I restriction enzyme S subunit [Candidatus Paceibacteria bacterium]|jgi:type I restriction enzyme S subunit
MIVKDILTSHKQGFYKPGKQKGGNVHFVRISDINNSFYLDTDSTPMIEADKSDIERFSIKKDDFLFARTGGAGRFCLIQEDLNGIFASYLIRFRFNNQNDSNFLRYFFMSDSFQKELKSKIHGGVNQNVHAENIKDCNVPEIELSEQKQIVATLDKAFAAIDTAKANAEQNLQNVKELFESYLQNVFSTKGDDWEEGEFGNIITTLTDYHANGSYKILKKNVELKDNDDYAWMIRSTDFEKSFKNQFKYIDEHAYNFMSKSKVFGNEIIMSKIGNAGKTYLMPKIDRPISLAMNLFLIRLDESRALPQFVFRFLKSEKGESQIKKRVKGATTKTITKDNVRNIIISYPSLETQKDIVQKLDILSLETKKLEVIYTQKIADLEEMKNSVLQKAFSGQLNTIN